MRYSSSPLIFVYTQTSFAYRRQRFRQRSAVLTPIVTTSAASRSALNAAMFKAAATNDLPALHTAIRAGAELLYAVNGQGQTVMEMAQDRQLDDIVRWLGKSSRALNAAIA